MQVHQNMCSKFATQVLRDQFQLRYGECDLVYVGKRVISLAFRDHTLQVDVGAQYQFIFKVSSCLFAVSKEREKFARKFSSCREVPRTRWLQSFANE
jgi:hypothetical protein